MNKIKYLALFAFAIPALAPCGNCCTDTTNTHAVTTTNFQTWNYEPFQDYDQNLVNGIYSVANSLYSEARGGEHIQLYSPSVQPDAVALPSLGGTMAAIKQLFPAVSSNLYANTGLTRPERIYGVAIFLIDALYSKGVAANSAVIQSVLTDISIHKHITKRKLEELRDLIIQYATNKLIGSEKTVFATLAAESQGMFFRRSSHLQAVIAKSTVVNPSNLVHLMNATDIALATHVAPTDWRVAHLRSLILGGVIGAGVVILTNGVNHGPDQKH